MMNKEILFFFMFLILGVKSQVETESKNGTSNVSTTFNLLHFVSGMGKSLQQLLSRNKATESTDIHLLNRTKSNATDPLKNSESEKTDYRVESEELREEIGKHITDVQHMIVEGIGILRQRGDVVTKRMLEQLSTRLEHARVRANKVLSEPENSEMAIRTLRILDDGITQLGSIVRNILSRINITINVDMKKDNTNKQENAKNENSNKN